MKRVVVALVVLGALVAGNAAAAGDGTVGAAIVTGRSSNRIDTFPIDTDTFDVTPGGTPSGFDFDNKGRLLVSLAGVGASSGAASYAVGADSSRSTITDLIESGERAACWLVASKDGRFAFVANAASGSVSTYTVSPDGTLEYQGAVTIPASRRSTLSLSENVRYVHVLAAGSHGIVELQVGSDGSLTALGAQGNVPSTAAGSPLAERRSERAAGSGFAAHRAFSCNAGSRTDD